MSSSLHFDNREILLLLILCKSPTYRLDDTELTAETQNLINFSTSNRKWCLSLHYDRINSFLFVNVTKIYQSKARDYGIKKASLTFRKCFS